LNIKLKKSKQKCNEKERERWPATLSGEGGHLSPNEERLPLSYEGKHLLRRGLVPLTEGWPSLTPLYEWQHLTQKRL
jgi:hypothetical protein